MKRFNIVLEDNESFILASCPNLELAEKYLKEMKENDLKLKEYYNWSKLPKYKIVIQGESKGEN